MSNNSLTCHTTNKKRLDLIDRKALLAEVNRTIKIMENQKGHFSLRNLIVCIKNAPTVDAVEVVHGKWIKGDGLKNTKFIPCSGILYCSNCKNEAYWDTDYGQQKFDYCPNCGASMRDGDGNV